MGFIFDLGLDVDREQLQKIFNNYFLMEISDFGSRYQGLL